MDNHICNRGSKALLNWSNNREHILSLSLTSNCERGFKRGPISHLQMLFLLAYIKKKIGSSLILATTIDSSLSYCSLVQF